MRAEPGWQCAATTGAPPAPTPATRWPPSLARWAFAWKVGHYCLNPAGRPPTAADIRGAEQIVSLALGMASAVVIALQARQDYA